MPMPKPSVKETEDDFVSRFMEDEAMRREYPDQKQRAAVAHSTWRQAKKRKLAKAFADLQRRTDDIVAEARRVFQVQWIEKGEQPELGDGEFAMSCEICKVEDADDHTFVWGPVLVPEVEDKQGDVISKEEIEEAAHAFLQDSGRPGLLHRVMLGNRDATIVESSLLRTPYKVSKSMTLPVGSWMLGMNVYNERIRQLITSGKLKGYSIGGQGVGVEE